LLLSRHAELVIGTVNTVLLVTSSVVFSAGIERARRGDNRFLFRACIVTLLLGVAFLALKGYEWALDFDQHLFPGPTFSITGADGGAAQIFWSFYFVATGLHGLHMIVGVGLLAGSHGRRDRGAIRPVGSHRSRSSGCTGASSI
jgi:cytochrome c oxidase subunit 3